MPIRDYGASQASHLRVVVSPTRQLRPYNQARLDAHTPQNPLDRWHLRPVCHLIAPLIPHVKFILFNLWRMKISFNGSS